MSLSRFLNRVLCSHLGHVLLAISWTFILLVMVGRSLTKPMPWFVDCVASEQEVYSQAWVNIVYPIWTVIIFGAHLPSALLTQGVMSMLAEVLSLSCTQTTRLELMFFFVFSSIQWLLVGFVIESFVRWLKFQKLQ